MRPGSLRAGIGGGLWSFSGHLVILIGLKRNVDELDELKTKKKEKKDSKPKKV